MNSFEGYDSFSFGEKVRTSNKKRVSLSFKLGFLSIVVVGLSGVAKDTGMEAVAAASTSLSLSFSFAISPLPRNVFPIGEKLLNRECEFGEGDLNGGGGDSGEKRDISKSTSCMCSSSFLGSCIDRCSRNFDRGFVGVGFMCVDEFVRVCDEDELAAGEWCR